jgi:hypothetical protein
MAKDYEEKRSFPRVKADLKVDIHKSIRATSIDLSENGISVNSSETISSPNISLRVHFPDTDLKMEAKLVWRRNLKTGGSSYGMEFVDLTENQKSELRKELIKTEISGLLNEIKARDIRERVYDFFLKDMLNYINEVIKLSRDLLKKNDFSEDAEKRLGQLNNQILLKGYCLDELLSDKIIIQKIKEHFRHLVGVWSYKSMIVKRGYEKPRGYPGDYKMLEIVYDNVAISKTKNIGLYFDNYFLKSPYAVAVRIRKDHLREILQRYINDAKINKIDILDIACGSCREIKELLPDLKTDSSITFSCLDWDEEALQFSQNVLLPIRSENVELRFIKEDIINIIKNENAAQSLGAQNLIYSIGLIDYLPDRILKRLINALYRLLPKDGKLILTHKNKERTFPSIPPDWFCDWKFVSRNKEEVIKLFYNCDISGFTLSSDSDDFGYIHYFTITKL